MLEYGAMAKQSQGESLFAWQIRGAKLPDPLVEYRFHPTRKWRFDFAWPDLKIAAEIEGGAWSGGRHTRGYGFEKDCEKYNAALLLGWRVLRFTTRQVKSELALETTAELLRGSKTVQ